jgi:hypothetical protein
LKEVIKIISNESLTQEKKLAELQAFLGKFSPTSLENEITKIELTKEFLQTIN